jgi:hypothetical protein
MHWRTCGAERDGLPSSCRCRNDQHTMTDRTPTTAVYLPDPANDETLTMSGYDWWRYRAAIEAEARAEPPRIVTLAWDATAEDVARIRRDWEAAAEARAEGLDVEHPDCGDRCACYVRGVDDEAEATRD